MLDFLPNYALDFGFRVTFPFPMGVKFNESL